MSTPFSDIELIDRIRWYVAVRWFFLLAIGIPGILSLGIYYNTFTHDQVIFNTIMLGIILLINGLILLSTYVRIKIKSFYELLSIFQICLDIALMTVVFQSNSGIETPMVMLFCIPIIMSGVLLSKSAVFLTGFTATSIFSMLALLDFYGILKPDNIAAPQLHITAIFWPTFITTVMILITITFVTHLVGHLIRKSSRLIGELEGAKIEKAKTDAIIQSMGSSLVAVNTKGKVILVNHAFEQLTGWRAHEAEGQSITEILQLVTDDGKGSDDLEHAFATALSRSNGSTQHEPYFVGDNFLKRKNGSTFSYIGHLSPVIVDRHSIGATFVFDDASAIREVGQLKSNFVALASHQLKTPIGEIKNYTESMLGGTVGKLTKKQESYIEHMRDISTHCNQLVTYLLDMSLLEKGELRAKSKPIIIYDLLIKTAELYKGRATSKGLKIKVAGDRKLTISGDETMLREVIGSLIANGISYSDSGTIELSATKVGSVGCIEVTDQGIGIDQAKPEQLFRKEAVLDELPQAGGGTGLGLYLAYEFVRLQGGVLMVDKNDSKGTIFRIELPVN